MMKHGRTHGERMSPSRRIKYAKILRTLLDSDPSLSIEKLVKRTGAPYDLTNLIKRRWKGEHAPSEAQRSV